jgi:putative FmdB family regulatory protein
MPLYEYACAACGPYEVSQRITDAPLRACPKCGGRRVQRLISASSFALKGSGWYRDLYGGSKSDSKRGAGGGKPAG